MLAQEYKIGVIFDVYQANSKFKMPMDASGVFKTTPVLAITIIISNVSIKKKGNVSFFLS